MTKGISADAMNNDLIEARVQYRGTLYVLRELAMDDYDKTVAQATKPAVDEDHEPFFDSVAHTKILLAKSLVEPKISVEELYKRGTRLVRGLQRELQNIYWSTEPDELQVIQNDADKIAEKLGDDEDDAGEAAAAS